MTQYEQIIEALKKLGGKATVTEICDKMDFSTWTTKTPRNSVSRYLTCSSQITQEIENGKYFYTLNESIPYSDIIPSRKENTSEVNNDRLEHEVDNKIQIREINKNNGLYFICLSSDVNLPVAGSLFKVGKTENQNSRLNSYSYSLPFEPIRQIAFFPVPIELNLQTVETELRAALLSSDDLGINMYTGGRQKEWLQTLLFDIEDKKQRNSLVIKVNELLNILIEEKLEEIEEGGGGG